jgi:hypothetical protein
MLRQQAGHTTATRVDQNSPKSTVAQTAPSKDDNTRLANWQGRPLNPMFEVEKFARPVQPILSAGTTEQGFVHETGALPCTKQEWSHIIALFSDVAR